MDGDTGGIHEHFVLNVRTLERLGVSAVIIEDKIGLKKNSLFGIEVDQTQDSIENFSHKISEGKKSKSRICPSLLALDMVLSDICQHLIIISLTDFVGRQRNTWRQ